MLDGSYFNLTKTATKTIYSLMGYMPTVAHWVLKRYSANGR